MLNKIKNIKIETIEDFLELTGSDLGLSIDGQDFLLKDRITSLYSKDIESKIPVSNKKPTFKKIAGVNYVHIHNEIQAIIYKKVKAIGSDSLYSDNLLKALAGIPTGAIDEFELFDVKTIIEKVTSVEEFDKLSVVDLGLHFYQGGDLGYLKTTKFDNLDILTTLPFIDGGPFDEVLVSSTPLTPDEILERLEIKTDYIIGLTTINEAHFNELQTTIINKVSELKPELEADIFGVLYSRVGLISESYKLFRQIEDDPILATFAFDKDGLHSCKSLKRQGIRVEDKAVYITIDMNHHRVVEPSLLTLRTYKMTPATDPIIDGDALLDFLPLVTGDEDFNFYSNFEVLQVAKHIITANIRSPKTSPITGMSTRMFHYIVHGKGVPNTTVPYTEMVDNSTIPETCTLVKYEQIDDSPYLAGIDGINGHGIEFIKSVEPIIGELFDKVKLTGVKNYEFVRPFVREVCLLDRFMDSLIPSNVTLENLRSKVALEDAVDANKFALTMLLSIYTDFDPLKDEVEVGDKMTFLKTVGGILSGETLRSVKDRG
jgi:hypothetical protein